MMLDDKNLPMIKIITKHLIKINKNADINLKYKVPVDNRNYIYKKFR